MLLFGYFDFVILAIIIFLNFKNYGKINLNRGCWIGVIAYGIILPFISMIVELEIVEAKGGWMDSFEVAYTFLRFPTYWMIGIIQSILIGLSTKEKE